MCEKVRVLTAIGTAYRARGARRTLPMGVWDAGIGRRGDALCVARSPHPLGSKTMGATAGERRLFKFAIGLSGRVFDLYGGAEYRKSEDNKRRADIYK